MTPDDTPIKRSMCLAIRPGDVDFPPRCRRAPGHDGQHQATGHYGVGEEWE